MRRHLSGNRLGLLLAIWGGIGFCSSFCVLGDVFAEGIVLGKADVSDIFVQNNVTFYDPSDCIPTGAGVSGNLVGDGNFEAVYSAKNADKYFFNGSGDVPSARWSEGNKDSMKTLLETYGDLAYQLGKAVGAPYVAILVQMRYEDPQSVCGANNFWGNGCSPSHAYAGGSTIQGRNLGEGFAQYGATLTNGMHNQALGVADPKLYLEKIGPTWVNGNPNGPGYALIGAMKNSVDALQAYIDSPEGQAIVSTFGNYDGGSVASSSPALPVSVSGSDVTWIGDSYSVGARSIIENKLAGISFGGSVENANSYIQSNKFVDIDNVGGVSNPSALNVLQRIIDAGELKPYLVMAVGTNGGWTDEMVNKFKDIMSQHADTKVVFVTAKAKSHLMSDDNGTNQRLKELTDGNENYYLADWAAVYDEKYFTANATHPTANGGYDKWVEVIYEALSGATKSGCTTYEGEYPQYLQCDAKWGDNDYGGSNMCNAGCGAASLAMLVTAATGKDVLPTDVAALTIDTPYWRDNVNGEWKRVENTKKICEKYGCEAKEIDNSVDAIRQALKDGWMIHLSGGNASTADTAGLATTDTATNPFLTEGHYVGIFNIDGNDNVMVADSAGDARRGYSGRFNRKMTLEQAVAKRWSDRPIMAIKGEHSAGDSNACETDENYCGTESGDSGATMSGEGDIPIGNVKESSVDVACDSRTSDIGVYDGYFNYVLTKIRLCALDKPGYQIKSGGAEENGNYGVSYSGGYAIVNSRVSGAYAALAGRYNSEYGKALQANSSFRSNAHQIALWDQYGHNAIRADRPGHSTHQGGLAIDFSGCCGYRVSPENCSTPLSTWLKNNLGDFGLSRPNRNESWHVQTPW